MRRRAEDAARTGSIQLFGLWYTGAGCTGDLVAGDPFFGVGVNPFPGWGPPFAATDEAPPDAASLLAGVELYRNEAGGELRARVDDVTLAGPPGPCSPDPTSLCLVNDRFRVEANWRTATGSGLGRAVEINDASATGTGYFWFFEPTNVEVVVKVIDACGVFDRVWVFAGGLTNQEVDLRVTDTTTGQVWTHRNPLDQVWRTVTATDALDVCE